MSFAFVFPGQGSQSLGMMKGFDTSLVRQTFEEASTIVGQNLWALCQEGADAELIHQTIYTQPLMLTAGISVLRAWCAAGGQAPSIAAGHSLGEYTALVAAGTIGFSEAVKLVQLRARLMASAIPSGVGAMAAILGLEDTEVQLACEQAAQGEIVEAVNFNAPGQVVIAGTCVAVERAIEMCKSLGAKKSKRLNVSIPSHCVLMKPAAEQFEEALRDITFSMPAFPILHNVDVLCYEDPDRIKNALVRQLYSPVRWVETICNMVANSIDLIIEVGPGKVLTGLNKRIIPEAQYIGLTDMETLEKCLNQLL